MIKKCAWLTQKPIAHRGLHNGRDIPENSLAAFALAIERGYPIECDVRMSADGELVVFHDAHMKRLTGENIVLKDVTTHEMKAMYLYATQEKIPTLQEVLALVDGRVPLLIEVKNTNHPGDLERKVQSLLRAYGGLYALQSFNPLTVLWFQRHMPQATVGQIIQRSPSRHLRIELKRWLLRGKWFLSRLYPDFVTYEDACFPNHYFVSLHKRRGIPILAWTIDSTEKREKVQDLSDNIIFETIDPLSKK